jgi:acylphosphatase
MAWSFKINEEVMLKREHMIVSGVVQGVGFRKFIDRTAKELNLSGWVRNLADGTVEINAQGQEKALAELFCHAIKGPARSKVITVQKEPKQPDSALDSFAIIT